jgi:hypothetical protein
MTNGEKQARAEAVIVPNVELWGRLILEEPADGTLTRAWFAKVFGATANGRHHLAGDYVRVVFFPGTNVEPGQRVRMKGTLVVTENDLRYILVDRAKDVGLLVPPRK